MDRTMIALIKCPLCKEQPCRHSDSLCSDKDYLTDLDDSRTDHDLWLKLWAIHGHPSEGADLGPDIAKYQDKLDRCQRITDKRKQIEAEKDANMLRLFRSFGYSGPDFSELVDWTLDIEEVKKDCLKKIRDDDDARQRRKALKVDGSEIVDAQ